MKKPPTGACKQCWDDAYREAVGDALAAVEKRFGGTAVGRGAMRTIGRLLEKEPPPEAPFDVEAWEVSAKWLKKVP